MRAGRKQLDTGVTDVETARLIDYMFYCLSGVSKFLYVSKGMTGHTAAQMFF